MTAILLGFAPQVSAPLRSAQTTRPLDVLRPAMVRYFVAHKNGVLLRSSQQAYGLELLSGGVTYE